MKTLYNWYTCEDVKYLYRLGKVSLEEAHDIKMYRQVFTAITAIVVLVTIAAALI